MRRRLLNFLTALSLLPGVAVVAMWVRSYAARDTVQVLSGHRRVGVHSVNGLIAVMFDRLPYD